MYAIIQNGSKQYRVEEGDEINVELLETFSSDHTFSEVLFVQSDTPLVGTPFVEGWNVQGEILGESKGPKTVSFKRKRRKNCRKKIGHRQHYTRVKITAISDGKSAPKAAAKAEPKASVKTEEKTAQKAKVADKKPVAAKKAPASKAAPKKPAAKKTDKK